VLSIADGFEAGDELGNVMAGDAAELPILMLRSCPVRRSW
jgi:hypothetical protein